MLNILYATQIPMFFILLTCSVLVIGACLQEWQTVLILIIWLRQDPADLDLLCFLKGIGPDLAGQ